MKILLYLNLLAIILFGCGEAPPKVVEANNSVNINQLDSVKTTQSKQLKRFGKEQYIYDSKEYTILIRSIYYFPDSLKYDSSYYCEGVYLFAITNNGRADSIMLEDGEHPKMEFRNVTDSFHSKTPVFLFASQGDSDQWTTTYISYKNDSLKELISIADMAGAVELHWKDDHTMIGSATIRDELISYGEDCPIRVSLDDYTIKYDTVLQRSIGLSVKTVASFKGYRILDKGVKVDYMVKKGTEIWIDSLNRINHTVRLKINDSIVVMVPLSRIQYKIPVNNAG